MDMISIRYFVALAQNVHFTKTAQQLYISQQNLSQHIKKLEDHYQTTLFIRKPQLKLTPAGEVLYESYINILKEEDIAQAKVNDIIQNNVGTMVIGASPYRGQFWIPRVLPGFISKWPNITTKIKMERTGDMERDLLTGDMDFFVGIKSCDDSLLRVKPLMSDRVFLVIPKSLIQKHVGENVEELIHEFQQGTTLSPFEQVPFIRLMSNYKLREQVNLCFQEAGFSPKNILELSTIETMISLLSSNIAAFFCTGMRVPELSTLYPDVCFFPILYQNHFVYSNLSIVYHKDHYFPRYSNDFIEDLTDFFSSFDPSRT